MPARLRHKSKRAPPVGLPLAVLEMESGPGDAGASSPAACTSANTEAPDPTEGLRFDVKLDDPLSNNGIVPQPAVYVDEDGMSESCKPGFFATMDSGVTYKWHRKLEDVRDWFALAGHKVSKSKLDNINVQIEACAGRATKRANANRVIHMKIAPLPRGVWFMSKAEFEGRALRSTVSEYDNLPVVYDADIEDNDVTEITAKELDQLTGEMESFCVQIAKATVVRTKDQNAGAVHAEAASARPLPPPGPPPKPADEIL